MGRPKEPPDRAMQDYICARLAAGETLRGICKGDDMPAHSTVISWCAAPEFADQYARARQLGLDVLAEEMIEIADTCREGVKTKVGKDGVETVTGDMVDRSRLQIDARKWLLSKLRPDKYGDKLHQEVTGAGGKALEILITRAGD